MAGQPTMSGQDDYLSGQTFGLLVILTKHFKEKKHFHWHLITFQEANLPFFTLFFVCYSSTFKLLLCFYQYLHFDWSEERCDWAKISCAGQHDRQQSLVMTNKPFTMVSLCQCLKHTTCSPLRSCKILSFSNSAGPFPWPDLICNQYIRKVNCLHGGRMISVCNKEQN